MGYRLKKGVVLFHMCGGDFIFPSREAEHLIPVIITATPELAAFLSKNENNSLEELSPEALKKVRRLIGAGFVEEC